VALTAFLVVQARGSHPMMPLSLFRSRPVAISMAGAFAFTVGFYGMVFLLSLYFQQLRGLSTLGTGLAFVPVATAAATVSLFSPRVAERFGPRAPIAAGLLFIAAGLLAVRGAAAGAQTWLLAVLMIPIGFGGGLAVPSLTTLLLDSVPAERAGTAGGVLNTCRQLGGALAVAVFGALVSHRASFLHGLQVSLLTAALLALAIAAASLLLPRRAQRR
jgi:DHA2 family methylenomycin A resistance protein-like MFS transporter